ncbi:hypothetical protein CHS0354_001676, partial [Potamilus streckersoni]
MEQTLPHQNTFIEFGDSSGKAKGKQPLKGPPWSKKPKQTNTGNITNEYFDDPEQTLTPIQIPTSTNKRKESQLHHTQLLKKLRYTTKPNNTANISNE